MSRYYKNSSIRISLCPCNEEVKKKYYFYLKKSLKYYRFICEQEKKSPKKQNDWRKEKTIFYATVSAEKQKLTKDMRVKKTYVSEIT